MTSISAVVPNANHLEVLDPNWTGRHTASTEDYDELYQLGALDFKGVRPAPPRTP